MEFRMEWGGEGGGGRESVIVFEVDYTLQAGGSALVTLANPTMGGPQFLNTFLASTSYTHTYMDQGWLVQGMIEL